MEAGAVAAWDEDVVRAREWRDRGGAFGGEWESGGVRPDRGGGFGSVGRICEGPAPGADSSGSRQSIGAGDCRFVPASAIANLGTEPARGAVRSVESVCAAIHGKAWRADGAFGNFFGRRRSGEVCGEFGRALRGEGRWPGIGEGSADLPEACGSERRDR